MLSKWWPAGRQGKIFAEEANKSRDYVRVFWMSRWSWSLPGPQERWQPEDAECTSSRLNCLIQLGPDALPPNAPISEFHTRDQWLVQGRKPSFLENDTANKQVGQLPILHGRGGMVNEQTNQRMSNRMQADASTTVAARPYALPRSVTPFCLPRDDALVAHLPARRIVAAHDRMLVYGREPDEHSLPRADIEALQKPTD